MHHSHLCLSRRKFIQASTATYALASARVLLAEERPRFAPNWASLLENYRAPDWFRDAKLGLWAHWSAQCVPETGDWYARSMYIQGTREYQHHISNYGHPTGFGFMEIENLWKAQNWDPEGLLDLYQKAGAKNEFTADADVKLISVKSGDVVLDARTQGPYLWAKVPAGQYKLQTTLNGKMKESLVAVNSSHPTRAIVVFPQGTDQ